jgi:hypothetical protein
MDRSTTNSRSSCCPAPSRELYHEGMVRMPRKVRATKNGTAPKGVSELGKTLRKISDAYVAGGGKLLNRRQLEREVADRRASR